MRKITARRRVRVRRKADPDRLHRRLATAVIAFHDAVARKGGMGISDHKCLGALAELGTATAGELARETGFTSGAITGIVDRLEKAGCVRREPNPRDRRSVLVRPLREKRRLKRTRPLFRGLSESMARLRGDFSRAELAAINRYLARATEILKDEARKLEA